MPRKYVVQCGACGNSKEYLFQEITLQEPQSDLYKPVECDTMSLLRMMVCHAFFHGAPKGASEIQEIIERLKEGSMSHEKALSEAAEIASYFDSRCN